MNLTLRPEDRRAVDLILDRSPTAAGNGNGNGAPTYAVADPSLGQRVAKAQQLLSLLDSLPAQDPPADLLRRTVRTIDQSVSGRPPVRTQMPHLIGNDRPVA